ncbi:MAG TPA: HD-GYP domain-containing protein [Gammaproteobacteria bacterium]|nr:HD-GYP domain-containing protein [Gammaproteobacteria bacterium]
MIKSIKSRELRVGMYVQKLDCAWVDHPFLVNSFHLKNEKMLNKVIAAGIENIDIDTSKGLDVLVVEPEQKTPPQTPPPVTKKKKKKIPVSKEERKARAIYKDGTNIIRNMMEDVRLGKQVEVESVNPVAEKVVQSIFRNPHALTGITRIKTKDEYTFMHCVSVTGLMVMFARYLKFSKEDIHEVAIGSLVHDIGKIMVPDKVLNKPGKLNFDEFEVMKDHVTFSREILENNPAISQMALDVAVLHHERMDGSGYPRGLAGDEISLVGQMSAIVDVYDALTSVRVYKDAWEPSQALKSMIEWSPGHFSRELVQQFIQCLGIYPVGSLVELKSGRVGIVLEQNDEEILRPKIRIIYNAKSKYYVEVNDIDLSKETKDRITAAISPKKYNIELSVFL